jgi:threonine/homoserine/homoserine lactone efflux protein
LLTSNRGALTGSYFAVGWVVGLSVVATVAVVLVHAVDVTSSSPGWIEIVELALGAAFLAGAVAVIRKGPPRVPHSRFVDRVDSVTRSGALGLGGLVSIANPKILALALGAALVASGETTGSAAADAAFFTAIGALAVVVPLAAYVLLPTWSRPALTEARNWIARHERPVLTAVAFAIGTTFIVGALP